MGILPKNEPQKTIDEPKNFFIYGETMGGKSYLAGEFPNPLFLSTDGNAKANPFPSIPVKNIRKKTNNGWNYETNVIEQIDQVVTELQTEKHTYETLVLDVIDDIIVMFEQAICAEAGVESIGDIPYGKGYSSLNSVIQQLVIDLKQLPMNIIYISRISTYTDEYNTTHEVPSLKEKYVNIVNGNCDLMVQCEKIGKNYLRKVEKKRKNYQRDNIEDKNLLKILDSIIGVFEKSRSTPIKKQNEIVKERETEQEETGRKMPKIN